MKKFLTAIILLSTAIPAISMSYDDAIESKKPMVLYMYSNGCPFCQQFNSNFTSAQNLFTNKFNFVKENIQAPEMMFLSEHWNIKGVPFVTIMNPTTKTSTQLPNNCLYDKTCFMNALKDF